MNEHLIQIREQRARLIERAARQRDDLALHVGSLSGPIGVVDRGLKAIRYVKDHPVIAAAAAMAVIVLQPRRSAGWVRKGLLTWQTWRWLSARY